MRDAMNLATYIDHTLLKPDATTSNITQLCKEAIEYSFYAVCVNSGFVSLAHSCVEAHTTKVASTIGFPLGSMSIQGKVAETQQAVECGAHEIDMVINIGYLKSHTQDKIKSVLNEIKAIRDVTEDTILKVIIETCLLTDDEKKIACELCISAGVNFVKTSTGFSIGGATLADVAIIKTMLQGTSLKIKASGGIRDYDTAMQYINVGVDRIGTSNGITIVNHASDTSNGEY